MKISTQSELWAILNHSRNMNVQGIEVPTFFAWAGWRPQVALIFLLGQVGNSSNILAVTIQDRR